MLQALDPSIVSLLDEIRGYNFVRNTVAHAGGYYEDPSTDVDVFNKLLIDGADIRVEIMRGEKKPFYPPDAVLKNYLDVIRKVVAGLLKGAHKLDYLVASTGSPASAGV